MGQMGGACSASWDQGRVALVVWALPHQGSLLEILHLAAQGCLSWGAEGWEKG